MNAVAFSPDGRMLASASDDGTVRLWDSARDAAVTQLGLGPSVSALTWHDARIGAGTRQGDVVMLTLIESDRLSS